MSTVPDPRPDGPLPQPGAPAESDPREIERERREALPSREGPDWLPEPYEPGREQDPAREPAAVP